LISPTGTAELYLTHNLLTSIDVSNNTEINTLTIWGGGHLFTDAPIGISQLNDKNADLELRLNPFDDDAKVILEFFKQTYPNLLY